VVTGSGEVVAEHTLVAPGVASVLDAHYGGHRDSDCERMRVLKSLPRIAT
jgi:hypothetical protein